MSLKYPALIFVSIIIIGCGWWFFTKNQITVVEDKIGITTDFLNVYKPENDTEKRLLESKTREAFSQFMVQNTGITRWQTFSINTKPVSVNEGLAALQAKIPAEITQSLNDADWGIKTCNGSREKPKLVLRLSYKVTSQGELVSYSEKQKQMKNWEKTMFQDVKKVIFPDFIYKNVDYISPSYFGGNAFYDLTGIRQTTVNLGTEKVSDFGYVIVGDYVLVGSDIKCIYDYAEELLGLVE